MNKRIETLKYIVADWISALTAWGLFYIYRKMVIEAGKFGYPVEMTFDRKFYFGIIFIPLFWILIYALIGLYKNIFRKSRLKEIGQTLYISFIGVLVIFFTLLLDDTVVNYKTYYHTFITLLTLQFVITATLRFILSTAIIRKIRNGKIYFNTLLVGSNQRAVKLLGQMQNEFKPEGNRFVGFVHVEGNNDHLLKAHLPHLGNYRDLPGILKNHQVEEVIIAIESAEHDNIGKIINELEDSPVIVKIIPDMYDILSGSVKMNAIFGAPLIEISPDLMPPWQQSSKRIFDILVSLIVLLFFSPLYIFTALGVILTSKGPLFYSHERIGLHGRPFKIYKFRSMYANAEAGGPQLSSRDDERITKFGSWMRKIRLDEIPQFYNVLIGDMSIVGPRPERQFFIDQIMTMAPHYRHLHKVRPGITSWGQVKFGYAENVDQMVERLKYDIIYIENMSLLLDLKIMFYTFLTVIQHRGK
jgi:exopolysaccharide biosynthesis polyprenyl glycosylphosphotransferase